MLRFLNTMSGRLEPFEPLDPPRVHLYCCGPTVYDYSHIGNFRTFMFADVLNRYLRFKGFDVRFVMNVTDIDDKTIRNSAAAGKPLAEYTEFFTRAFLEDLDTLRLRRSDTLCRATHHIGEMLELVSLLEKNGHTYLSDGSVYYKIAGFTGYGKLSKKDFSGIRAGARVDADEYEKEDARDFVLWKGHREGEPSWNSPWGPGRPGWHLECSAMSMKYLGPSFDLHCGGADLIFPHHENEIAQSEGATGVPFVKYWLHSEYLIVNGEKMSKSKGNYFTLRDLTEKGFNPVAIRYLLLSAPYRKQLNFTEEGIRQAQAALDRVADFLETLNRKPLPEGVTPGVAEVCRAALERFETALDDDLNTAGALAAMFDFIREINRRLAEGRLGTADRSEVLGVLQRMDLVWDILKPVAPAATTADQAVEELVSQRTAARQAKEWKKADVIRDQLKAMGVVIKDTPEGTIWRRE